MREIDFHRETVQTREGGEEHTYILSHGSHSAKAGNWIRLQNAAFKDVIDLYSQLGGRTVLLHPAVERGAVSLQAEWTNHVPEKAEITFAFEEYFKQRGSSIILDGERFVQLVPSSRSQTASPRSRGLPAGEPVFHGPYLENVGLDDVVRMYASASGRRRVGDTLLAGYIPYFHNTRPLSKAEALYALETLIEWNGWKIILGPDNTFSVELGAQ